MLARVLWRTYTVEAFLYAIGAGVLLRFYGWNAQGILAFVLVSAIFVRLWIFAIIVGTAWRFSAHRAPHERLRVPQLVKMLLRECRAMFALYCLWHPFERLCNRRAYQTQLPPLAPPVVLIHGFFCNGAYWKPLLKHLLKHGIRHVYTINLDTPLVSIEQHALKLARFIEDLCERTGARQVVLVGHSMGGIVARLYVQRIDDQNRVKAIVALGSPHHGTRHADLSIAPDGRQMKVGHPWLLTLNAEEPRSVPIVNIYSMHDTIVAPQDSARLESARNIELVGIGHLEMSANPVVRRILCEELAALTQAHPQPNETRARLPQAQELIANQGSENVCAGSNLSHLA